MTIKERYAHWWEVIKAQKISGISIAEYCQHQHIQCLAPPDSKTADGQSGVYRTLFFRFGFGNRLRIVFGNLCIETQHNFDPTTLRSVLACLTFR